VPTATPETGSPGSASEAIKNGIKVGQRFEKPTFMNGGGRAAPNTLKLAPPEAPSALKGGGVTAVSVVGAIVGAFALEISSAAHGQPQPSSVCNVESCDPVMAPRTDPIPSIGPAQ